MLGSSKQLRLKFTDDFDDYPDTINNRPNESASTNAPSKPLSENLMIGRRARRQRQNQRRKAATAIALEKAAMPAEEPNTEAAPLGLQYGKNDPSGIKSVADGYIPLENFPKFPKLPLEMRREVWHYILPEPQAIFVFNNGYIQSIVTGSITRKTFKYRAAASYKVPRLTQVNKETRYEVMIYHRPAFATNFGGIPIYYNRKTDLLHFDSPETLLNFYGGSAPNHLPRSLTNGFRLNMREFHNTVSQLAFGNVRANEGMIGAILSQMKGLKVVLIEDKIMRPDGKDIIESFCHGGKELVMGWDEYTVERPIESRVTLRYVDEPTFKQRIEGWTGRIISEEEEAAERAARVEAKLIAEAAAQRELDKLNRQNELVNEHGSKRKRQDSDVDGPISKRAKA
ncbi:uncharacterized protein RSE6_04100 [Rhynchosporium secalis]|uniref:2EXR domain-containing protein n=1 Tax=Rhynchosporium secalis TaxID=38038 RepID=A0A1E1M4F8_RHYSE|nr:uncharacterized protein RSE6_04100 [Rhynchosporium secalis]